MLMVAEVNKFYIIVKLGKQLLETQFGLSPLFNNVFDTVLSVILCIKYLAEYFSVNPHNGNINIYF